jgi:hypothetical protein
MKLVIYPPVEDDRLRKIQTAAGDMTVVNAADETKATAAIVDADAFFGKLLPPTLAAAKRIMSLVTCSVSPATFMSTSAGNSRPTGNPSVEKRRARTSPAALAQRLL